MPRPPMSPARNSFPSDEREAYDYVVRRFVTGDRSVEEVDPGHFWGALLHSPPFAANRQALSSLVRTAGEKEGSFSHHDRELADQVLAHELRTNVVQRTHVPDAMAVGVRIEAIEALRAGRDDDLTAEERLVATYCRQVVSGRVTDETYDAMEERLGTRGLVEYTMFITMLQATMRTMQAFACPEPTDAEIDAIIQGYRTGSLDVSGWRDRIR